MFNENDTYICTACQSVGNCDPGHCDFLWSGAAAPESNWSFNKPFSYLIVQQGRTTAYSISK